MDLTDHLCGHVYLHIQSVKARFLNPFRPGSSVGSLLVLVLVPLPVRELSPWRRAKCFHESASYPSLHVSVSSPQETRRVSSWSLHTFQGILLLFWSEEEGDLHERKTLCFRAERQSDVTARVWSEVTSLPVPWPGGQWLLDVFLVVRLK